MRETWKPYLWQVVGLLFYLFGMLLFLVVAIDVFTSPPENSIENLSNEHLLPIGLSVLLFVIGRLISWRFGANLAVGAFGAGLPGQAGNQISQNEHPDQTVLEKYGYYHRPADSDEEKRELDEVAEFVRDRDANAVYCEECGTANDREFDYCGNCAAELPE